MKTSFPVANLPCLLKRQLSNFFPVSQDEYDQLCEDITCALSKVQYNFPIAQINITTGLERYISLPGIQDSILFSCIIYPILPAQKTMI